MTGHDQETTAPAADGDGSRTGQPAYRGPFRQRGLGTRVDEYERRGTTDFYAGEYRTPRTAVCPTCRVPGEHCLCRVEPDRLRYALAQISLIHHVRADGMCAGCGTSAMLCGYLALLDHVRGTLPTPPPDGAHLPGGV